MLDLEEAKRLWLVAQLQGAGDEYRDAFLSSWLLEFNISVQSGVFAGIILKGTRKSEKEKFNGGEKEEKWT